MSKSYENGTKIYELVIDEQGKEFFTKNTLFLDKNGTYRIENNEYDGKSWHYCTSKELNTVPKRFEYNSDEIFGWNVRCYVIGDDCNNEVFIAEQWKKMKTIFNEYIDSEIKKRMDEINFLYLKKFIV